MADPWFKFYAADYLLDEQVDLLPLEAQGILIRIWCLCWRSGSIPDAPDTLALRTKVEPRTMRKHWPTLRPFFVPGPEGLVSERMEKERSESKAITEARRYGAQKTNEKRWGSKSLSESHSDKAATNENVAERVAERSVSESESESETTTPLPPKGGIERKRRGKVDKLLDLGEISPEAVKFGKLMAQDWLKEDPDGRQIHTKLTEVITRMDGIAKRQPVFSPEVQYLAGLDYLKEPRKRYKAAQYFLSLEPDPQTDMPPFKPYCVAVVRRQKPAEVPLAS